jgi:hypothetical protein
MWKATLVAVILVCVPGIGSIAAEPPETENPKNDGEAKPTVEEKGETELPPDSLARFFTLEDIYGLSGNAFQGAIGFITDEGTPGTVPQAGFGIVIDDMTLQWREFDLQEDTTECNPLLGGGSCASVEIEQTRVFEGSTTLGVTILDQYPYDSTSPTDLNDCELDGAFDGTDDCNGNGTPDIVARATSESTDEEVVVLDEVSAGIYTGTVTTSATFDVDGVLFLVGTGTDIPTIRIQYVDRDDGTGNPCPNDTDPAVVGTVEATSTVFLTRGNVVAKGARITNDPGLGDDDAFADTNETVKMFLTVSNKTGMALDRVVARVVTSDPKIECVLQPVVVVGALAEDEEREADQPVVFKVASDAQRSSIEENFTANFAVTMSAAQFDSLLSTQNVVLSLDLDVTGGGGPTTFSEGFEVPDIASSQFTAMPMDELPGPSQEEMHLQSDGFRCQYNDCDGPNCNGGPDNPNWPDCFLGFVNTSDNAYDWHVHRTDAVDGGRAFSGDHSLHFGKHGSIPDNDTTRLKQLDAIRTTAPINLDYAGPPPELSFKQQVSFMDYRGSGTPIGESVDRAVAYVRFADADGNGIGDWIKIFPYHNVYDVQGTDAFINCKFDPIDDGSTEDDYFDPSDPFARLGPSSTCFPEFVFGYQGDTDWRKTFNSTSIGRASDGPGLPGSIDRGTWVETRFLLSQYGGRRVFLRFLVTSIEVGDATDHMEANITDPNDEEDDGWYLDELVVTGVLTTPAILSVDTNDNSGLPGCGPDCTVVSPALAGDPPALAAPGQITELSAQASFADNCTDGTLQYRFWIDGDVNGVLGDPADTMLRDWTDNAVYVAAPTTTTPYGVSVRCSSAPETCLAAAVLTMPVACPSNVAFKGLDEPMFESIFFEADKQTLSWQSEQFVDVFRGNLDLLRSAADFDGTFETCLLDDVSTDQVTDPEPPAGRDLYYLARGRTLVLACNEIGGWGTGTDAVDRNAEINASTGRCP